MMQKSIDLAILSQDALFSECVADALQKMRCFSITILESGKSHLLQHLAQVPSCTVLLKADSHGCSPEFVAGILDAFPEAKVLILGTAASEPSIVRYLEAGVKGYLPEESSLAEVTAAIDRVIAGDIVCSNKAVPMIFGRLAALCSKDWRLQQFKSQILTFREREILELMARGLTNEQIGAKLSISVHTVKNHVHNILGKMHVDRRLQAIQEAYQKRWLKVGFAGS
jgi:DNA-binding NarL/FixJ family response regulator